MYHGLDRDSLITIVLVCKYIHIQCTVVRSSLCELNNLCILFILVQMLDTDSLITFFSLYKYKHCAVVRGNLCELNNLCILFILVHMLDTNSSITFCFGV